MLKSSSEFVFDIEASGLLDETTIDYAASPFKLKDTYKVWCIVVLDSKTGEVYGFHDGDKYTFDGREHSIKYNGEEVFLLKDYTPVDYIHLPLNSFKSKIIRLLQLGNKPTIVGHNIINYDLLALKLAMDMDYDIEVDALDIKAKSGDDYWCGLPVVFDDTFVRSKTLNPDRYGGHSLEKLAAGSRSEKFQFRKSVPSSERFSFFDADMLYYNIMDVKANLEVKQKLDMEMAGWDWDSAIKTEKSVADVITRQTHRGFKFDSELAIDNVRELDILMEDIRERVEPLIPAKPATATFMKDFTPPKNQLKKNLELAANMVKFKDKMVDAGYSAELTEDGRFIFEGTEYTLPMEQIPLVTTQRSKITDTTHIKNWVVSLGWKPTEYKDRCLATDPKTKTKYDAVTFQKNVARYVDQTFKQDENGEFICKFFNDRLEHLGIHVTPDVPKESYRTFMVEKLHSKFEKSCKVLTNPTFTVGQEKEVDPALEDFLEANVNLTEVKEIIQYMTYRHRRNSIMGGEFDPDEDEEPNKGFLSYVREDGRIATPADTCGAACVVPETRIVTDRGVVPIIDVNIGDLVLTHTGTYKPVIAKVSNGVKPILRLTSETGLQVTCTENHPFLTPSGWVRADQLQEGSEVFVYQDKETWGQIKGLSNYYISSWGRVLTKYGNEIKLLPRQSLWSRADIDTIDDLGQKRRFGIGAMVLMAFVSDRPDGMECCHKDGNPCNNALENLKWGTSKENSADSKLHGRALKSSRDRAKLSREDVNSIKEYFLHHGYTRGDDSCLAKIYGCSRRHIGSIRTGRIWSDAYSEENDYKENFKLVRLTRVEPNGLSPTYDITVDEDHSYVADGFVTHNTSRMKHRVVANVPRTSSLYGDKMRAMFGVDNTCFQVGYDFDSLKSGECKTC